MARTFNCGVGAALVVSKDLTEQVLRDIQQHQEEAWVIGRVVACPEGNCSLLNCCWHATLLNVTVLPPTLSVHLLLQLFCAQL